MSIKERLDQLLVDRGLAESKTRAQALVLAGQVYSGERRLEKPGMPLCVETEITVRGQPHPWVSRGGLKLDKGLEHFGYDPRDLICADIGASTGGFTDVLLSKGAAQVYAVDVGYGQLAQKLRTDDRVVVLERTNARHLTREQIPHPLQAIVCDASFIGLGTVLPAAMGLVGPSAFLVALIKPQFEAGREHVGKGGVVRDPAIHDHVCQVVEKWLSAMAGWQVDGVVESPITGPNGNREFLIGARFRL